MSTPVKCTKSTVLYKMGGATKHRTGPFLPKRAYQVPKRTKSQSVKRPTKFQATAPISALSALILLRVATFFVLHIMVYIFPSVFVSLEHLVMSVKNRLLNF